VIPVFSKLVARMEPLFDELMASKVIRVSSLREFPDKPAIYLLSEGSERLYVGRARSLQKRMRQHSSRSHYSASFAFKLARIKECRASDYTQKNSAKTLMNEPQFLGTFLDMVRRVQNMDAHYVEEPDDKVQYLFEMYATLALNVPYCDFSTH
jgi:hypothetical protein